MVNYLLILLISFFSISCEEVQQQELVDANNNLKKQSHALVLDDVSDQQVQDINIPIKQIDLGIKGSDEIEDGSRLDYQCSVLLPNTSSYNDCSVLSYFHFSSHEGVLVWVPQVEHNGIYKFKVRARAGSKEGHAQFKITVSRPESEIRLNHISNKSVTVNTPLGEIDINDGLDDKDANGNTLTYNCRINNRSCLSYGVLFDSETGVLNWTPSKVGIFKVKVFATNGQSQDFEEFNIVVKNSNQPPRLDFVGHTFLYKDDLVNLNFNDGQDDYDVDGDVLSYSCHYGNNPCHHIKNLSFNKKTGQFLWNTKEATYKEYEFRVVASDGSLTDELLFRVNVQERPNRRPVIDPIADRVLGVGNEFTFFITDGGDNKDIDGDTLWFGCFYDEVIDGHVIVHDKNKRKACSELGNLGLDSKSGKFVWKIKQAHIGKYEFVFHVSDGPSKKQKQLSGQEYAIFEIRESVANNPPKLDPISNKNIEIGSEIIINANDNGDDLDKDGAKLFYTCFLNNKPCSNFNSSTGILNYVSSEVGVFPFKIIANDGVLKDEESFLITVNSVKNNEFRIDTIHNKELLLGSDITIDANVFGKDIDGNGNQITYTCLENQKVCSQFNKNSGVLKFSGNVIGFYSFKIRASSKGKNSEEFFSIIVKKSGQNSFELDDLPSPIIVDKSKNDIINFSVNGNDKFENKSINYQCFYDSQIDGQVAEIQSQKCPHFINSVGNLMASIWFESQKLYELKIIASVGANKTAKVYTAKLGTRVEYGDNHLSLIYPQSTSSPVSIPKLQLKAKNYSKIKGIQLYDGARQFCGYKRIHSVTSETINIDLRLYNCALKFGTYEIKVRIFFNDGTSQFSNGISYTVLDIDDQSISAPISINFEGKNSSTHKRVVGAKVKVKKDNSGKVDLIYLFSDVNCTELLSSTHLVQDGGNDPQYTDINVTFPLLKSGTTSIYAKRVRVGESIHGGTQISFRRSPCSDKLAEVNFLGSHYPKFNGWKEIKGGANYECGLSFNQQIYCRAIGSDYSKTGLLYGRSDISMFGELEFIPVIPPTGVKFWTKLFVQGINPCAIGDNGKTYCWGRRSSYNEERHAFYLPTELTYAGASTAIHQKLFKLDSSGVTSSQIKELYRYDLRHCQLTNANMCLNETTAGCFETLDDTLFCGGKKVENPVGVNSWKTIVDGFDFHPGRSSYARWCGLTESHQMYCSKYYSGYVPKNVINAPVVKVPNTEEKIQTLNYRYDPSITEPTLLKPINVGSSDSVNLVEYEIHWDDEINFKRIDVFLDASCSEPIVKKTFNPYRAEDRTVKVPFTKRGVNRLYARLSDKDKTNGEDKLNSSNCVGPLATYNYTGQSKQALTGFKKVVLGYDFDCAIGSNNGLYCRGLKKKLPTDQIEYNNMKTINDRFENFAPILVKYPTKGFKDIKLNAEVACALSLENQLYCNGNFQVSMKEIERPSGVQYWEEYILLSQNDKDPILCALADTGDVYCGLNHNKANIIAAPNNEKWIDLKRAVLKVSNNQSRIFLQSSSGNFYQADHVFNYATVNATALKTPVDYRHYIPSFNVNK